MSRIPTGIDPKFVEEVRQKCHVTEEGCWLYRGSSSESGHPKFFGGSGRRQIWTAAKGPLRREWLVTPECLNPSCLCPAHLKLTTKSKVSLKVNESPAIRALKTVTSTRYARSRAKLTMEKAREIRSSDATCKALGDQYGVHFSLISAIRKGHAWRESFTSPFAGLGQR